MKNGKAYGTDEIPAEFWKVLLEDAEYEVFKWALDFCNMIWYGKQLPVQWHESRVVALFKKGDMSVYGNYRPILLINLGYRLFASIILLRMIAGGADSRIWGI